MTEVPVRNRLSAAHQGRNSALHPMIAARARQRGVAVPADARCDVFWDARWWGLEKWAPFVTADLGRQDAVLRALTRYLLNEAYFIEKSGSAYAAKMMLLAPDTDTAQLYGLIAGDEAVHLGWIEPFVDEADKTQPAGAFLTYLSSLIETASPQVLILLVQIVLEGWGMDHYRRLADGCLNADLTGVLKAILKDEALHHQSGVVQFDAAKLTQDDRAAVAVGLKTYAAMVAAGPLAATAIVAAHLPADDDLAAVLGHPSDTRRKLDLLLGLMDQPGLEDIVASIRFETADGRRWTQMNADSA